MQYDFSSRNVTYSVLQRSMAHKMKPEDITDLTARQPLGLYLSCFKVRDTPACYMFRPSINSEIIHLSSTVVALTGSSIDRKINHLSSHAKVQNTVAFSPVLIYIFGWRLLSPHWHSRLRLAILTISVGHLCHKINAKLRSKKLLRTQIDR